MKNLTVKQSNGFIETTEVNGQNILYKRLRKEQPVVMSQAVVEEGTTVTPTVQLPPASWMPRREECKVLHVDFGYTPETKVVPKKKVNKKERLIRKVIKGSLQGGAMVGIVLLVMSLFWCNIGYNISFEEVKACFMLGAIPTAVGAIPLLIAMVCELLNK